MKLTDAEITQLEWYLDKIEDSGNYYGNKRHFDKRHENIRAFVDRMIIETNSLKT